MKMAMLINRPIYERLGSSTLHRKDLREDQMAVSSFRQTYK